MPQDPYLPLLHRELHVHDVRDHFAPQLTMLRDVVNYGSTMIPACFVSSGRQMQDIVILTVLFKQVIRMLDAFEVLISNACVPAAVLPWRTSFEASVSIDWILMSDTERKALYYYVANVRREREWVRRSIQGREEHQRFFDSLGEFADVLEETRERIADSAVERLNQLDEFLGRERFLPVSSEFDRVRGRKQYDPPWHEPLGRRSVRALSEDVDRLHEYEIFYSQSSETVHSSAYREHIEFRRGQIILGPIRNLESLNTIIRFGVANAFHTYRRLLEVYRPGQIGEFNTRYIDEWREPFMNIPEINYQAEDGGTII